MNTETTLREIMSVVFRRAVGPDERPERATEPNWDSLRHVELIFSIEDAFELQLTEAELMQMDSFEKLLSVVEARSAARG